MLKANNLLSGYFLRKGNEFTKFWEKYLKNDKKLLYILGLGFDPRTLSCLEIIHKYKSISSLTCIVINYDDEFNSKTDLKDLVEQNKSELSKIIPDDEWKTRVVRKQDKNYSSSMDLINQFKPSDFQDYSDLIIDISCIPTSIYFPLIKTILDWIKDKTIQSEYTINLHIVVAENAKFDSQIGHKGVIDDVKPIFTFSRNFVNTNERNMDKIWIPILGEMQKQQLKIVSEVYEPIETLPVLPSSSSNPYRAKNLVLEYREILFDSLDIDTKNFIYSHEQNPFETFRHIYKTALHNYDVFKYLGGCNVIISPLSSKLLNLGSFFAAYILADEKKIVGVVNMEAPTYQIEELIDVEKVKKESIPFTMWITGDVYS